MLLSHYGRYIFLLLYGFESEHILFDTTRMGWDTKLYVRKQRSLSFVGSNLQNSFRKYTDMARAQTAFSNIIGEVWSKPKRMVRSASYTNLTYYKEAQHDYPIKVG